MQIENLGQIGLTEGEIKIYDALLELGETTRTELAKKSGISPSKVYDVANRLIEKGIISSVKKQGVLHFSPANPERLKYLIESKKTEIEKENRIVQEIMPLLLFKYNSKKEKTDIEVFYGWEGMKTVYSDLVESLSKGDVNYIFGASKGEDVKQADIFYLQHSRQIRKKGIKKMIIFNEDLRNYPERLKLYNKPHEVRYLHQDTFVELNIYKNVVLLIMLLKRPIVIRIRSKEAADSYMKFFRTMWKQAKP